MSPQFIDSFVARKRGAGVKKVAHDLLVADPAEGDRRGRDSGSEVQRDFSSLNDQSD